MAESSAMQERIAALVMSGVSILMGGIKFLDKPDPDQLVELPPDWYMNFTLILHGVILLALLVSLARVGKMTEEKRGLRLPFLILILAGIVGAAYVVGRDLGMV